MSSAQQKIAIVSVFDKTGLLDLAKGLVQQNVRILASGGTARLIRESGFPVECASPPLTTLTCYNKDLANIS